MKALLTTLFVMGLMAALAAGWMDGLVDQTQTHQALQEGLHQRRRDWGQRQHQRAQSFGLRRAGEPRTFTKLPLGPLFQADQPQGDAELAWMEVLLSRLCLSCHPSYLQEERQAAVFVRSLFLRIAEARQPNPKASTDPFHGFTGKLAINEDLLAIPLDPDLRLQWQALLVGAPPCSGALMDWIEVASFQPVPFDTLPPPVLQAIFGTKGAEELSALQPELREAATAKWLDTNGVSALRRLVDFRSSTDPQGPAYGPADR